MVVMVPQIFLLFVDLRSSEEDGSGILCNVSQLTFVSDVPHNSLGYRFIVENRG